MSGLEGDGEDEDAVACVASDGSATSFARSTSFLLRFEDGPGVVKDDSSSRFFVIEDEDATR